MFDELIKIMMVRPEIIARKVQGTLPVDLTNMRETADADSGRDDGTLRGCDYP